FYGLLGFSGVILLYVVLTFCRQQLLLLVSSKAASQLTCDFFTHVLSLPMPFFLKNKIGEITSRFEENQKVTDFLSDIGPQLFLSLFTVALYLSLMSYFNVALTLVTLGFVVLHIVIMGVVSPFLQRAYKDSFEKGSASQSYLIECLRGLSTIKMLAIERRTRWEWENLYVRYSNAYFRSLTYSVSANLASGFVANASEVGVLFYGGGLVLRNQMTVGELTAFIFLIQGVTAPLMKLVMFWATFQETLNAADRLNEVFNEPPELSAEEARTRTVVPPLRGDIRLEHVNFRYEVESNAMFLQDISLDVRCGQRIAFVGRSGSGKSTLLKLLLGFYPPLSGKISLDGYNLMDAWLPSVRAQIGIIPQMTQLFEGTIQENIALAKPGAPLSEIMEAAQLAMAHEFITALPQGYSTRLEVSGANLSGGQRQRLAIARALVHDPRMLILDEATSALDNETERLVMNNLEERFKDRTILMTAHRLSTVRHADLIVVLERGRILEQGSHEQLLTRKGLYYFLHAQQTEE
ncbi:MAG: peptidase domain-containing ABC transporter, partial [Deltaproteobacteria bacterium]|nr:peptidase domain-containing ABC transporter [Deltaproteobacteria bacterium]